MNPEQLTSTPTKQDLQNEEIQKLTVQTHLEVQQREDIRRDLAERMKFVPFVQENTCFTGKKIRARSSKDENLEMFEGGNHCGQGPHGCCQYWCDHISGKHEQAEETVGHCGLGRNSGLA